MSSNPSTESNLQSREVPRDFKDWAVVGRNSTGSVVAMQRRSGRTANPRTWLKGGAASGPVMLLRTDSLSEMEKPAGDVEAKGISGPRSGSVQSDHNSRTRGKEGVETWRRMRKTEPVAWVTWLSVILPIVAADWSFQSDKRGEVPQDVIDRLNKMFGFGGEAGWMRGGGQRFLMDAMRSLIYGFSPFEEVWWAADDGLLSVDLEWRHPMTIPKDGFKFDDNGVLNEVWQDPPGVFGGGRFGSRHRMDASNMLIFSHDQEGDDWRGTSMFRPALRAWDMKGDFWLDQASLIDRYGSGIPYAEIDRERWEHLNNTEQDQLLDEIDSVLLQLRAGERQWLNPGGWGVAFGVFGGRDGVGPDILKAIDRCDYEIQLSGVAPDLGLGRTERGIRAIGEHFGDIRGNYILSLADDLASRMLADPSPGLGTVSKYLKWEHPGLKAKPRLVPEGIKDKQFRKYVKDFPALVMAKIIQPDDVLEDAFRGAFDLPPLPEEMRGRDRSMNPGKLNGGNGSRNGRAPLLTPPEAAGLAQGGTPPADGGGGFSGDGRSEGN